METETGCFSGYKSNKRNSRRTWFVIMSSHNYIINSRDFFPLERTRLNIGNFLIQGNKTNEWCFLTTNQFACLSKLFSYIRKKHYYNGLKNTKTKEILIDNSVNIAFYQDAHTGPVDNSHAQGVFYIGRSGIEREIIHRPRPPRHTGAK